VVLGASGMLGSMVVDYLAQSGGLDLVATTRKPEHVDRLRAAVPGVRWVGLDAERAGADEVAAALGDAQWVVNAIGVIKPYIKDDNAAQVERATRVNALFPHLLAGAAKASGCRVLQIATDCVYSGQKGRYAEPDPHDALDVYGKTKSLGEVYSPAVHHLRCSIIGPEPFASVSLLHWFIRQPRGAGVNGYTNHLWNGVTTLQFARLCRGAMADGGLQLPHAQHVVPTGSLSKADMLRCFAREYGRGDVTITPGEAKVVIDRTLSTADEATNRRLWAAAGYAEPPTVPDMIAEMARFNYRLAAPAAGAAG
jgi:dTDP-4-dehydrorhamnose reductase